MNSKQTDNNQGKGQIPDGWTPDSAVAKTKTAKPTSEEMGAQLQEMLGSDSINEDSTESKSTAADESSAGADESVETEKSINTSSSLQTELADVTPPITPKRMSGKQRKESLEEYRQIFLSIPKLQDRKPVFISCEVRDQLDEIARKLGGRRMSVSGFIENLARHHLTTYKDEVESWKKL